VPGVMRKAFVSGTEDQRVALVRGRLLREQWKQAEQATWRAAFEAREQGIPVDVICQEMGLSESTFRRYFGSAGSSKRPGWWNDTPAPEINKEPDGTIIGE
jgi:hypothetical protein